MPRFALSVFLIVCGLQLTAQDCFEFHKKQCCPAQGYFAYSVNDASVSYGFVPGESRCVPLQLFQGKDYRITICSDSLYNGIVSLVIKKADGRIFYDNSQDEFNTEVEFSCRNTTDVDCILTAPNRLDVAEGTKGCIGLLIEETATPKIGF